LIAGYAISVSLIISNDLIAKVYNDWISQTYLKLVLFYVLSLVQLLGCVLIWRGLWNFYNIYVTFDLECLSEWVTTVIGISGGLVLGCISTFTVKLRPLDGCTISRWPIRSISLEVNPEIH